MNCLFIQFDVHRTENIETPGEHELQMSQNGQFVYRVMFNGSPIKFDPPLKLDDSKFSFDFACARVLFTILYEKIICKM